MSSYTLKDFIEHKESAQLACDVAICESKLQVAETALSRAQNKEEIIQHIQELFDRFSSEYSHQDMSDYTRADVSESLAELKETFLESVVSCLICL